MSVINTATNTVIATIPDTIVGGYPQAVAVTSTRAYVNVNANPNRVSVIDTSTNTVVATIPVGSGPWGVAVNPAGTRVYAVNFNDKNVSVIDTSTNTVVATITIGTNGPTTAVVNSAGTRAYVTARGAGTAGNFGTVSVIDTSTNTVIATIPGIRSAEGLAVNPAGTRVYAGSDNTVSVIG